VRSRPSGRAGVLITDHRRRCAVGTLERVVDVAILEAGKTTTRPLSRGHLRARGALDSGFVREMRAAGRYSVSARWIATANPAKRRTIKAIMAEWRRCANGRVFAELHRYAFGSARIPSKENRCDDVEGRGCRNNEHQRTRAVADRDPEP
jgi:hypothetical protein